MVAPVSVCMIVRDEAYQLEKCLLSIRNHVPHIAIVDTGSKDNSVEIARKYADFVEVYTGCNDPETGFIIDFANARQRAFSHSRQPWTMWIDGDDEVVGAEHLEELCREYDTARQGAPSMVTMRYDYGHDAQGRVLMHHDRERLVAPHTAFHWVGMVHEVLIPNAGDLRQHTDKIKIVHRRDLSRKNVEPGRNLRILKKQYEKFGDSDARHLYYLGMEYGNNNDRDNAIVFLTKYIEKSGWDDEKYMAAQLISGHHLARAEYEKALDWCMKAIVLHEEWGEAYFTAAKCCYFLAEKNHQGNALRWWQRCVHFARTGLALPPTRTSLFVNPLERDFDVHVYLNFALGKINDVKGALDSVNQALRVKPDDSGMLLNKRVYVDYLAKETIKSSVRELVELGKTRTGEDRRGLLPDVGASIETAVNADVVANAAASTFQVPALHGGTDLGTAPPKFSTQELLGTVTGLWKHMLLHDELLGARSLLKNSPWQIRGSDEVIQMLRLTDSMLEHIDRPESYRKMYSNYNLEREAIPLPEPIRPAHGQYARFNYLIGVLKELQNKNPEPLQVLDIGCMDGWVTNRIGLMGFRAFGIDSTKATVDIANGKSSEFRTGARHAQVLFGVDELPVEFPDKFDVIALLEVYEHVQDPVELIRQATAKLKPGGTLVLSTPRGSWCQGISVGFHGAWNSPKPREHIRAPITREVIADMLAAGLDNLMAEEISIDQSEQPVPIPTQASICVRGVLRNPAAPSIILKDETSGFWPIKPSSPVTSSSISSSLDVVFYVGRGVEAWNPVTAKRTGIGGSETAVIEMSRRLAGIGHKVRVFGDCRPRDGGRPLDGVHDGVEYIDADSYRNLSCDVLIASRRPESIDDSFNVKRKMSVCWMHDVHCGDALTHERALKFDKVFALSDWHQENILERYPYLHPTQMFKTRNGIDLAKFNKHVARNPHRAVYSSSPDRGMQTAITVWPRVRERVPDAELHIFYGFQTWEACANDDQRKLIAYLKQMLNDYASAGVHFHGRVSQDRLAEEYLKSGVWAYPTWFTETSCISAMEAHAAGLRMITSPIAALNETVSSRGVMIHGDWLSWDYQSKFTDAVVAAMHRTDDSDRTDLQSFARDNFGWDSLAVDWDRALHQFVGEVAQNVVPKYKGWT